MEFKAMIEDNFSSSYATPKPRVFPVEGVFLHYLVAEASSSTGCGEAFWKSMLRVRKAGGTGLEMTWKPPPWGLTFMLSEGATQAAKEENNHCSYPAIKPKNHDRVKPGKILPTGQRWHLKHVATNSCLVGFKAWSIGRDSCLVLYT